MKQVNSVGLIPDGNRRWAIKSNISLDKAYIITMKRIAVVCDEVFKLGSSVFCVYLLSSNNLIRPRDDLASVINSENYFIQDLLPPLATKWNANVYMCGTNSSPVNGLYSSFDNIFSNWNVDTRSRGIYLCVGYDPVDELKYAFARNPNLIDGDIIEYLSVPIRLDMVIRTSGEFRLSNFLPLQAGYAELFFLKKYFPDISRIDIRQVYKRFSENRIRRYGR
ncbi:MAG: undecaprenyl diphosphate synthase family protein [Anaerolineales bacterium]|nr:undecaprenyl diphosphate synthase family protein [Anaerolineales bacterium]